MKRHLANLFGYSAMTCFFLLFLYCLAQPQP